MCSSATPVCFVGSAVAPTPVLAWPGLPCFHCVESTVHLVDLRGAHRPVGMARFQLELDVSSSGEVRSGRIAMSGRGRRAAAPRAQGVRAGSASPADVVQMVAAPQAVVADPRGAVAAAGTSLPPAPKRVWELFQKLQIEGRLTLSADHRRLSVEALQKNMRTQVSNMKAKRRKELGLEVGVEMPGSWWTAELWEALLEWYQGKSLKGRRGGNEATDLALELMRYGHEASGGRCAGDAPALEDGVEVSGQDGDGSNGAAEVSAEDGDSGTGSRTRSRSRSRRRCRSGSDQLGQGDVSEAGLVGVSEQEVGEGDVAQVAGERGLVEPGLMVVRRGSCEVEGDQQQEQLSEEAKLAKALQQEEPEAAEIDAVLEIAQSGDREGLGAMLAEGLGEDAAAGEFGDLFTPDKERLEVEDPLVPFTLDEDELPSVCRDCGDEYEACAEGGEFGYCAECYAKYLKETEDPDFENAHALAMAQLDAHVKARDQVLDGVGPPKGSGDSVQVGGVVEGLSEPVVVAPGLAGGSRHPAAPGSPVAVSAATAGGSGDTVLPPGAAPGGSGGTQGSPRGSPESCSCAASHAAALGAEPVVVAPEVAGGSRRPAAPAFPVALSPATAGGGGDSALIPGVAPGGSGGTQGSPRASPESRACVASQDAALAAALPSAPRKEISGVGEARGLMEPVVVVAPELGGGCRLPAAPGCPLALSPATAGGSGDSVFLPGVAPGGSGGTQGSPCASPVSRSCAASQDAAWAAGTPLAPRKGWSSAGEDRGLAGPCMVRPSTVDSAAQTDVSFASEQPVVVCVRADDPHGPIHFFYTMQGATPLEGVFSAWTKQQQVLRDEAVFFCGDRPIEGTETPSSSGLSLVLHLRAEPRSGSAFAAPDDEAGCQQSSAEAPPLTPRARSIHAVRDAARAPEAGEALCLCSDQGEVAGGSVEGGSCERHVVAQDCASEVVERGLLLRDAQQAERELQEQSSRELQEEAQRLQAADAACTAGGVAGKKRKAGDLRAFCQPLAVRAGVDNAKKRVREAQAFSAKAAAPLPCLPSVRSGAGRGRPGS